MGSEASEGLPAVEAQATLAAIVESSDDAIVSKTLDGIITTWNKAAQRIFGYTAEEIIGKPLTTIIPPDRLHEEVEILRQLRAGELIDHYETVRQKKNGELIDVSVTISPLRNAQGVIVGASKIARDITAQKRVLEELHQAKLDADAARGAAELASRAKDQFLSVLSHELRTPLTPALAAVSLLELGDDPSHEELHDLIGLIRRSLQTQARLVDDLLDLTRISKGKVKLHLEVVDAHAVIASALAAMQPDIQAKQQQVVQTLYASNSRIWADVGRLQQILMILLSNAVKFSPQHDSIEVRTSNEQGQLKLEIIDSGKGIEPDALARVFGVFEQGAPDVHRRFGGLGLGLTIAKSLVEMHKGSVSASSAGSGKGATLTLRLNTIEASQQSWGTGNPLPRAGLRILLLEDHTDTRQVMIRLLRSLGCSVRSTGTVQEALNLANAEEFDLLVSDIGLPDGSGTDVMRRMREYRPVKGIAISGLGQEEDLERSQAAGFSTHLTKPVTFQALREAIHSVTG